MRVDLREKCQSEYIYFHIFSTSEKKMVQRAHAYPIRTKFTLAHETPTIIKRHFCKLVIRHVHIVPALKSALKIALSLNFQFEQNRALNQESEQNRSRKRES